jgi:hypothetical protein
MKMTKYFLTISEDEVFIKENYLDMLNSRTSTTSLTASTNTSLSASNCNQNLTSGLGSITTTTIGAYLASSWYNTAICPSGYIAYVDFFNCGLSLKLNSNNEFKIDGLFYNGKKYLYIIDTKLKQNILIANLNYTSFHEMFLDLIIKNLFEIIEL